jgi:hypothetical protein
MGIDAHRLAHVRLATAVSLSQSLGKLAVQQSRATSQVR